VQLGTGVLVLPLRQPIVVAKQVASLDVLAAGRTLLGVGSGWLEDEFALLGQGWRDRGQRTDQAIATLRGCWRPGAAELPDGTRVGIAPAPAQGDTLPILIGGHSLAAMRRAARAGDGWYASNVTVGQFAELVQTLRGIEAEQDPPREPLIVGVRPGVVDPADAASCAAGLREGGADFAVLDAPFAALDVAGAVDWMHRTADVLRLDESAARPVVSRRSWSAAG
jgi:alkanesulfonate monooxygenase SsuD/methylene tetrahydromethanopterin reductase-like flavin-dependent oxidoreductase (luciferase family)